MANNIHLRYPSDISTEPLICNLTRLFNLDFNIIKAQISSHKDGFMILELLGPVENVQKATKYLTERGIVVTPAAQRIKNIKEKCVECGMCTAICPTSALSMNPQRNLIFDTEKCVICTRCIKICPVNAMEADIETINSAE